MLNPVRTSGSVLWISSPDYCGIFLPASLPLLSWCDIIIIIPPERLLPVWRRRVKCNHVNCTAGDLLGRTEQIIFTRVQTGARSCAVESALKITGANETACACCQLKHGVCVCVHFKQFGVCLSCVCYVCSFVAVEWIWNACTSRILIECVFAA